VIKKVKQEATDQLKEFDMSIIESSQRHLVEAEAPKGRSYTSDHFSKNNQAVQIAPLYSPTKKDQK
jgi:hypothetical protein